MSGARKNPNLTEKLAGALLRIRNEDGSWLIPAPLRETGTAKEVCAAVQFDHRPPVTFGGDNRPQHLFPMLTLEHREKSKRDNWEAKKSARIRRKAAERRAQREKLIEKNRKKILAPKPAQTRAEYLNTLKYMHGKTDKKQKPKFDWKTGRYRTKK